MRDALKSDKQRESDAKAQLRSPLAQLVAKVQYMNQNHLTESDMEAREQK